MKVAFTSTASPQWMTDVASRPRVFHAVWLWPAVMDWAAFRWEGQPNRGLRDAMGDFDAFVVNVFNETHHVEQIKDLYPDKKVIAIADPPLDVIDMHGLHNIIRQLRAADIVGCHTEYDVHLARSWGARAVWMPSPIGPFAEFEPLWGKTKANSILALGHDWGPKQDLANISALARLQKHLPDWRYWFFHADKSARGWANAIGAELSWREKVKYPQFIELLAGCKLSIDLYPWHAQGRHAATMAMVGTPGVVSRTNNPVGLPAVDPYDSGTAVKEMIQLVNDADYYEHTRYKAREFVEDYYGFEASRARMKEILEMLWRGR